ncbi:MAG: hypothetical protein IIY84_04610 [Eubacterium sp.]|nr:hypothetical protein [Eubacterium sp.]
MAALQEYKCPCCGGAIRWDSAAQKLKCPYCDTEFDVGTLQQFSLEQEKNEEAADEGITLDGEAGTEWSGTETAGLRAYVCESCGGEIIADENMASTSCPYCGNAVVVPSQFRGILRPDLVIPFKVDKKAAKEGLRRHMQGKKLLPNVFKSENHIDEIKGVYVPFWLFSASTEADANYTGTMVHAWSDRDNNYTETSYFSVTREATLQFANLAIDGSSKMDDDLMDSIGPFDFSEARAFSTDYLAGYLTDKYDVDAGESVGRANERIRHTTRQMMAQTVNGYANVTENRCNIRIHNANAKYALYPVWVLNTRWRGDIYTFAMNGQTGKFIGNLPADKSKIGKMFFGIMAGTAAVVMGLSYAMWAFF